LKIVGAYSWCGVIGHGDECCSFNKLKGFLKVDLGTLTRAQEINKPNKINSAPCKYNNIYKLTAMKVPAYPENESTRINTLRSLNILDTSPEERFDRLTRLAKRLFGVPIALVSLVDADRQWFKSCQGLEVSETPRKTSLCGHAILGDDILMISDATQDERFHDNPMVTGDPAIRFYAGIPLMVPNRSKLGTLCLIDREPRMLSEEDQALLRDLGRMAEQELAAVQLATMDELTLLTNRRGFRELALHVLNLCKRLSKPVCLLFFDLDLFKEINDRYGHAEGDRALRSFSQILKDTYRDSDVLGRLGGDEFVVLLSNADKIEGQEILNRLNQRLDEHNQVSGRGYDICYSAGIIQYDAGQHQSIDDLLEAADKLMYQQKQERRTQQNPASPLVSVLPATRSLSDLSKS
jgi:diguanylate cyclase (GGDEF)-like protein